MRALLVCYYNYTGFPRLFVLVSSLGSLLNRVGLLFIKRKFHTQREMV
jgi:hypothetical protein